MSRIAIVVHGGAGPDSEFIRDNLQAYKYGIKAAIRAGYAVLEKGQTSVDAVEAAVKFLENNSLFNAGRGAALNESGEVEMCASIMNGKSLQCGAAALIKEVKHPVSLARYIMEHTKHVYIGGNSTIWLAGRANLEMMPEEYFITSHQYEAYVSARKEETEKGHGTVGAVAVDRDGNVAAATSTGGLENSSWGRIADSSVIGAGTYADNSTCAVSCTGDGEYMIRYTLAYQVAALVEFKSLPLTDACAFLLKEKYKNMEGDAGMIAIDAKGNIGIEFNSERMHRGWKKEDEDTRVEIY